MNHDLSENKKEKDVTEDRIRDLRKEYNKLEMSSEQVENLYKKMEMVHMNTRKQNKNKNMIKIAAIAASLGIFVALPNTSAGIANAMEQIPIIGSLVKVVTFRDYQHSTDTSMADIEVPEIVLDTDVSENNETLKQTAENINADIQKITDTLIAEYKNNLETEQGYQDVVVNSEILTTTDEYFSLKLKCYQAQASGYEWNYYYTIDLNTGVQMKLKDVFVDGADYINPITENIKVQMREQMAADENVIYWLDDEIEEMNFKAIPEDALFYINEKNNIVIAFNEGDVAPMYMGAVEFEIPNEVVNDIRK